MHWSTTPPTDGQVPNGISLLVRQESLGQVLQGKSQLVPCKSR